MPKPVNTSPHVLTVPDEALLELAELALVPPEQRELFFEFICTNLETAWERDGLIKNGLASKRRKKLVHAALTLYDTLGNLNNNERALIGWIFGEAKFLFDRISSEGMTGLDEIAYQLALLFSLMTGKHPPRYPSQVPETPSRGRRPGSVKNWIFQNFVLDLLISTATCGGSFTFAKEPTPRGTLVEAIRMLVHHLPDGFVPKPLPGSIIQRLVDRRRRLEKEIAELERD
jgi:hypothetical protein